MENGSPNVSKLLVDIQIEVPNLIISNTLLLVLSLINE